MRKIIILSVIGALILCFGTGMAQERKFLKMVSGPEGGSWYPLGSVIMRLLEVNIKDVSTSNGPGGGVGNCKVVQRGDAQLGWTYSSTCFDG